jgi:poly-gamma-glutamate synthesis protein (capsule biosynthesis protein)
MSRALRLLLIGGRLLVAILFLLLFLPTKFISLNIPLPASSQEEGEARARVLFVGDMMFDRYVRRVAETVGGDYVFSCIDQALFFADTVVGNLEGPITANPSFALQSPTGEGAGMTFTFPPETAALLTRHNIGVVSLGNNHTLDQGPDGLRETEEHLARAGVAFFGASPLFSNSQELENKGGGSDSVSRKTINGVPIAFVGYNEFDSPVPYSTILKNIGIENEAGNVVVVYAHWGEEYAPPTEKMQTLAHQFADAGAAIIIGSHPHIVQEHEVHNGAHIYYSLGNFIFDQYWDESVKNGLMLDVEFSKDGVMAVKEIPIVLHSDGRTCPRD